MSITPVSKTQPMREGEIDAIDVLNDVVDKINNANKTLWEGTFNSGNITVSNLSDYCLFGVYLQNESSICLVFSPPGHTNFIGGTFDVNTTPNMFALACRCLRNGNTLTYRNAGFLNVSGTTITSRAIIKIVGII